MTVRPTSRPSLCGQRRADVGFGGLQRRAGACGGADGRRFDHAGGRRRQRRLRGVQDLRLSLSRHGPGRRGHQRTAKPFLDVSADGRLGHTSPRGGLLWEDTTYNDRHVLLAAGPDFDPNRPGVMVVYFHGNQTILARDVVGRQQTVRQLAQSNLNAVMVAPQLAVDAANSSAGNFWRPGAFAQFLDEADGKLAELYPGTSRGTFRRMPVIIVAYSGGYDGGSLFADRGRRRRPRPRRRAARRALWRGRQVRALGRGVARRRVLRQRLFGLDPRPERRAARAIAARRGRGRERAAQQSRGRASSPSSIPATSITTTSSTSPGPATRSAPCCRASSAEGRGARRYCEISMAAMR